MERWELQNGVLEFEEENHKYLFNGEECISVTQLIKFKFPSKYDGIDPEILKKAAKRGTFLHESVEVFEKYGIESKEYEEFRNYLFLKKAFEFKVLANEIPIVLKYKDLTICGRLDLVLEEPNEEGIGLGDLKFTSKFDKEYLAYQLNLYKLGYEQSYGKKINFLRGIHLKQKNRKYAEIPINQEIVIDLLENYLNYLKENKNE